MNLQFKIIKPLIIGLGLAGKRHLQAQLKLKNTTGVYDINPEVLKDFKKNKQVVVFENFNEALNWANLIHVCTPDNKHTEYILKVIKNKKAILTEKPLTTNLKEALKIQRAVKKYKGILIVGQNYRLTPTFLESKKIVSQRILGEIKFIETTYLDHMSQYLKGSKFRKQQDLLFITGCHPVDLMLWIVNEKVKNIQAFKGKGYYQISLQFKSGILGSIRIDPFSKRGVNGTDLKIEGDLGQLTSHNKINKLILVLAGKSKTSIFPNTQTLTTFEEIKIVNSFLTGNIKSFSPLPDINEAISTIKLLSLVEKL